MSEDISLVFLDLMLPDLNGLEVLRKIKSDYPSIPVIIITAFGTEERCINAVRLVARDYIKKPFNPEEILWKAELLMNTVSTQRRQPLLMSEENIADCKYSQDIPTHILRGILKVKNFIDKNYASSLNLSDACRMAGINRTYFCYFFKRVTGHSFKGYLNNVKVRVAKELLRNRNLSITEIAQLLGYNDSNYFSTIFKKISGASPRHLRLSD